VYFQPDVWGALLPQIRQFWDDVVAGRAEAIATGSLNGEIAAKAAADAGAAEAAANGADAKKKAGGAGGAGGKRFAFLADSDID
jgi:hypothetical protein